MLLAENCLRDNSIQLLEPWPESPPDLNPEENCWTMVEKAVAVIKLSSHDLQEAIKQAWIE